MEIDSEVVDKESNVVVEAMIMARGQNTAIVADSQYKIRVIDLETGECRYVLYSNCVHRGYPSMLQLSYISDHFVNRETFVACMHGIDFWTGWSPFPRQ